MGGAVWSQARREEGDEEEGEDGESRWKRWRSPIEVGKALPTLVACEWTFRLMNLLALAHAQKTGRMSLWLSGWTSGMMNDLLLKMNPLYIDSMWQAQACIMLSKRFPLYLLEMYGSVIYISTVAARKFRLSYIAESIVCGLFGHLLFHCYDINGPRFLWWTFHDSNPYLRIRNLNAPAMASVWTLTFGAIHCIVFRWIHDPHIRTARKASELLFEVPQAGIRKLFEPGIALLDRFDRFHLTLYKMPVVLKILFCGTVINPLFQLVSTGFHLLSMDKLGVPGNRTYRMVVISFFLFLARERRRKPNSFLRTTHSSASKTERRMDALLFASVCFYFAVQLGTRAIGKPQEHVSTGCHQKCTNDRTRSKDKFGRWRTNEIRPTGPNEFSKNDFRVATAEEARRARQSGQHIIAPNDLVPASQTWYTIFGMEREQHRKKELAVISLFCVLGVGSFWKAFIGGRSKFT